MNTENTNLPNDPHDAAAYWFARVHSGNLTVAEHKRFKQWRLADPRNEQEYRALDQIWQATNMLPEQELRALLDAPEPPAESRRLARRRWLIGTGSICTAAIVGGVLFYGHGMESPIHVLHYATAHGEQRKEVLPDGSVIEMNVASQLVVRYYASRRTVELMEGEATFEVVSNHDWPFIVNADSVDVKVTGTVFNVRRNLDSVSVAVQSGSVEVTSGRWWDRKVARLTANTATQVRPGLPITVAQADVAAMTAWREGKVVFKDQPLESMVREMNRYLSQPIRLTDSRLAHLRMAGVFNIRDAEGFLQALQAHLPVVVVRRQDGGVNLALLR